MKKLLTLTAITLFSAQAFSATDAKFVAVDKTLESNLCVVAAQQGYQVAKDTAEQFSNFNRFQFNSTICNGVSIKRFAKKFEVKRTTVEQVVYRFKPSDDSEESRFCAIAAEQGLQAAVSLGGKDVKNFICNGKDIAYFARKYQNS